MSVPPKSKIVKELYKAFDAVEAKRRPRVPAGFVGGAVPTAPAARHALHRELYVEEARKAIVLASQYADLSAAAAAELACAVRARDDALDEVEALRACGAAREAALLEALEAQQRWSPRRRSPATRGTPASGGRRRPLRAFAPAAPQTPRRADSGADGSAVAAATAVMLLQRRALHLIRLHYVEPDDGSPRYEDLCHDLGVVPHLVGHEAARDAAAAVASPDVPFAEFLARLALRATAVSARASPAQQAVDFLQVLDLQKDRPKRVLDGGRVIRFDVWPPPPLVGALAAGPTPHPRAETARRAPRARTPAVHTVALPFTAPPAARGVGGDLLTRGL